MKADELRTTLEAAMVERVEYKRRILARTLAEHGEALIALLEACEARSGVVCRPSDNVHAGCWNGYHVAGCPVARADADVASALAAVHAIPNNTDEKR